MKDVAAQIEELETQVEGLETLVDELKHEVYELEDDLEVSNIKLDNLTKMFQELASGHGVYSYKLEIYKLLKNNLTEEASKGDYIKIHVSTFKKLLMLEPGAYTWVKDYLGNEFPKFNINMSKDGTFIVSVNVKLDRGNSIIDQIITRGLCASISEAKG